jgi:hypothetical protein
MSLKQHTLLGVTSDPVRLVATPGGAVEDATCSFPTLTPTQKSSAPSSPYTPPALGSWSNPLRTNPPNSNPSPGES